MPISALPTAPSPTDDRPTFSAKSFAHVAALHTFTDQANTLEENVNALEQLAEEHALDAQLSKAGADAAAALAGAAAGTTKWVSGTTYAAGLVVWSPINFLNYRRKTAGGGAVDPSADTTNWAPTTPAQSSPTDATPGRYMQVGAFGLGSVAQPVATLLDTVVVSGLYSVASLAGYFAGSGVLLVEVVDASNLRQTITEIGSGRTWSRVRSAGAWGAWKQNAVHAEYVAASVAGAIDCRAGAYFTLTVAGATTITPSNVPDEAYAFTLEVAHTSGAITFPAGTVWPFGSAPTPATGKRHLFFFQKCQLGTAGWYASSLTDYTS